MPYAYPVAKYSGDAGAEPVRDPKDRPRPCQCPDGSLGKPDALEEFDAHSVESDAGPGAAAARASLGLCARFGVARGAYLEPAASKTGLPRHLGNPWKRHPAQATGLRDEDLKLPAAVGARSRAHSSSRKKQHACGTFGRAQGGALAAEILETSDFAFREAPLADSRASLEDEVLRGNTGRRGIANRPHGVMEARTPSGKRA